MLAGGAYQVTSLGVFIYSFDNKSWDKVTTFGYGAIWLNDSRSLLFTDDRGSTLPTASASAYAN